jgi:hypothetical protein
MMNVLLFSTAGFKLSGEGTPKDESFEITTLRLIKTDAIQAAFVLDSVIKIPLALLKQDTDPYTFRPLSDINAELTALRERLRAYLHQDFVLKFGGAETFLNSKSAFGKAFTAGSVRLRLPWLDGQVDVRMSAWADAQIKIQVTDGLTFDTTVRLRVDVKADDVLGGIEWVEPKWPAFNLPFPSFSFPNLSWDISKALENIAPGFKVPRIPFLEKFDFKWDTPPQLQLKVAGGDLTFGTVAEQTGTALYNSAEIFKIEGFLVTGNADGITVAGTVKVTIADLAIPEQKIDDPRLPFEITISRAKLSVTATNDVCTIALKEARVHIQAKKDPTLFLLLAAELEIVIAATGTTTKLTKLEVIQPYPIEFVVTAAETLIGELLRIHLPEPPASKPELPALLKRIADMLKAAAVWMAEQGSQAAQTLAGVAEAGLELLKQAAQAIFEAAQTTATYVDLEVRLDPKTYQVRQILISPRKFPSSEFSTKALGLEIRSDAKFKPCLVADFHEPNWVGLSFVNLATETPALHLDTDLWLSRATTPAQQLKPLSENTGQKDGALLKLIATLKADRALVLFAFRGGRIEFLQKSEYKNDANFGPVTVGETGKLEPLGDSDLKLDVDPKALKERIVNLLSRPKPASGDTFMDALDTYIKITTKDPTASVTDRTITLPLTLNIFFKGEKDSFAEASAEFTVDLNSLNATLHGNDRISIKLAQHFNQNVLGLALDLDKKPFPKSSQVDNTLVDETRDPYEAFYLDLKGGKEEFGIGKDAAAVLTLPGMASSGKGLQFQVEDFRLGRDGLNLSAASINDPVMLGGVNMPFRFRAGRLDIVNSKLAGATISGSGQLPPALMGEANVSINLRLAERNSAVVVESAEAKLDKSDDPIVCESTRFRFSLSKVEMSFEREGAERDGDYHFYFLLTGKARFQPKEGEFAGGLLKNLKELEFVLDRAPLTGDGRLLMERISFQAKVDPPKRSRFFDLFEFELRGIGLYPSAPAFDGAPAISISGQVKFTNFADKVQPHFRFHEMWVAPPKPGSFLPRVRFDGLTVGLDLGGMAEVEGTAIAVDEKLPSIYKPSTLPANVSANGFLASGRLSIKGWASMSAAMGFLELRRAGEEPRNAFFFYIQQNRLSIPIPTPVGEIYLREVGFGFGYRYTLAGIAEAETAQSPKDLVRILDEVSKYQGSLDDLGAWVPTYDSATLTLAMRAMFAVSSASRASEYNAEKEKELPNPLLFDVIAAIRSDLTFLMTVRAWLCVNYADWDNRDFEGRTRPTLRGYLYISVPKKTFLGRFVSSSEGFIGKHPKLPEPLLYALENIKFTYSSTLYITPGLFHFELGWPYELGVEIGSPTGNFYIYCKGGLINRIEDGAVLYGYALKAGGFAQIGVNTGGSFGAAVFARADFSIEGKLLTYVSIRAPGESMFYGSFRFDVHVSLSVRVWFEFSIFGGTVHLEVGFSLGLTLTVAVELAVLLNNGLGVRVFASLGIQAFGRSLCLGVELQLGSGVLDQARARVDRFLSLGLGTSIPETSSVGRPPQVEASREARAKAGDKRIQESASTIPVTRPVQKVDQPVELPVPDANLGKKIAAADFWAMLFPVSGDRTWFVLQLIPRDLTDAADDSRASFYSPLGHKLSSLDKLIPFKWNDETNEIHVDTVFSLDRKVSTRTLKTTYTPKPSVPELWRENFVIDKSGEYKDPKDAIRSRERKALQKDPEAAARELEMAGRKRASLSDADNKYRAIEERRSAMIGIIANSALQLAQFGDMNKDTWPKLDPAQLHCLDLDLTFLVAKDSLETLFKEVKDSTTPPLANFTIQREGNGGEWTKEGTVSLFNPVERMFSERQPRLDRLTAERRADGIALNWDLEPAWTASKTLWDDPEFHLRHYRIERYVDFLDETWKYQFEVKAAAPVDGDKFFKPPIQFLDDLTFPKGFPQELRDVITDKSINPLDWPSQYKHKFVIRYKIYAIDCAGTSDFGTAYDLWIEPDQDEQKGPVSAALQIIFEGVHLMEPAALPAPRLQIDLNYRLETPSGQPELPAKPQFKIAVLKSKPIPSGQYGADSLSGALEDISGEVLDAAADSTFAASFLPTGSSIVCRLHDKQDRIVEGCLKFEKEADFLKLFEAPGETLRFFIRQTKTETVEGKPSAWQRCPVELRMGGGKKQPPVDAVLEEYERPVELQFESVQRHNFTEAEAGRVYFLEPTEKAAIDDKGDLPADGTFTTVLDRKRRAGVRLRWKARPRGLKAGTTADSWRLVGGFHLFDMTHVEADQPESVAKPITVALLPQSARGLEPSEMGDLSLIEAAYPSNETRRKLPSWYSAAESAPLFPLPPDMPDASGATLFRRSLMPSVDEGLVAALFEKGKPAFLRVSVQLNLDGSPFLETVKDNDIWRSTQEDVFEPHRVREFLQAALLTAKLADGTRITIDALNPKGAILASVDFLFEACPTLHPVIADALDLVRYHQFGKNAGDVYRRYEVVLDPSSAPPADQWESWIDATPEQRDPYGWGILRTLGLAAGFRLYDTSTGAFLAGDALSKPVAKAFHAAKKRYPGIDLGAPFIDLFTAPMDTARAFSFDGGGEATAQDSKKVIEKQISIIQIALRPRVNHLVAAAPSRSIRYFEASLPATETTYTFTVKPKYDVDLVTSNTGALGTIRISLSTRKDINQPGATLKLRGPGYIRVRLVGRDDANVEDISAALTVSGDLTFTKKATDLLGTFDALDNTSWAMQFFGTDLNPFVAYKHESFRRLKLWTERANLRWETKEKDTEKRGHELSAFAGKVVPWWKRFLDHGFGLETEVASQPVRISLGTIGRPGTWRMPEDTDGTVGVFLLDDSEYGSVRRFIVRPYSRYEAFAKALEPEAQQPAPKADKDCLVDITLPRTAPVAKPVILSVARVPREDKRPEVLELIVARTPDEIISGANRTTAMGLASDGISVGFWREFAEAKWGKALLDDKYEPAAEFGDAAAPAKPLDLTLTDDAWGTVQETQDKKLMPTGVVSRATDAWLGAWVYRMQSLPYFYKIHALVHANAGVVVSEPSGATFVSGISHLPEPHEATYQVVKNGSKIVYVFDIPLLAFEDCMEAKDLWKGSAEYERLAGLPDPGISYRILLEAVTKGDFDGKLIQETLSTDSQFDISASLKDDRHFLVQGVGDRITLPDAGKLTWLKATSINDTNFWRLVVVGTGNASFLQSFEAEVPDCLKKESIDPQYFAVWKGVAPHGTATLDYKKPAQADEAAFIQYCQDQITLLKQYFPDQPHELSQRLLSLATTLPADQAFQIDDWWLGMPMPSFEGGSVFTLSNDFKWNTKPDATENQCSVAEKFMADSGCSAESAAELSRKLRQYFSRAHSAVITRAVTKEVFDNAQISETRPFDVIQMLTVVKQKDTYTEDKLKELIGKLERAIASMGAIEALKGKAAHIPWPASAKAHQALLDELFETTPQSYHLAAVATPASKDLTNLTGVFGTEATQLAQDAWFGPRRKPRLDAIRGTAVPTSKEIRHK